MTTRAYIFDAYGTLFDVHAAIARHRDRAGPDADRISELWRTKQLEYSWTLTAMGRYENFERLTERSLDFALARFGRSDPALRAALLDSYRKLDAYPDAKAALGTLKQAGAVTGILSNGSPGMLQAAVDNAALGGMLDHVLSVDALGFYKPRNEVYALVTDAASVRPEEIVFVSSNRWDIAGAANFGFKPVWINRANLPDEYPDLKPVAVINSLSALPSLKF
ncbi:MAG: haloacid dehalogenase type II [Xanthobacteraceae bacterium]|nr:haloacid dehalogenase type II [Xanthobacteraceae bacterium]